MIKQLQLYGWKSFAEATLHVDPLTILIGTNASGKSNALDALLFLKRIASGIPLATALRGDQGLPGIRGGLEWAALDKQGRFRLTVTVQGDEAHTDYLYDIECEVAEDRCELRTESLKRVRYRTTKDGRSRQNEVSLFRTDPCEAGTLSIITARLYNEKQGTPRQLTRFHAILGQLFQQPLRQEIETGIREVVTVLRDLFLLDPIPAHMREYSRLSGQIEPDAANIAGVIAALPSEQQEKLEHKLTEYSGQLPEQDIQRIYAERVGKFKTDAMLYCDERWHDQGAIKPVDARGMSDGTLRFLAIVTALMTRPPGSLLIVEEVDNGLHPSRAGLLLRVLKTEGGERGIDVLVTTHNPAFLDAAGPELVPFITVAHRDMTDGSSKLTLLEELHQLPKLLAHGPVGKLSSNGDIERALARST